MAEPNLNQMNLWIATDYDSFFLSIGFPIEEMQRFTDIIYTICVISTQDSVKLLQWGN